MNLLKYLSIFVISLTLTTVVKADTLSLSTDSFGNITGSIGGESVFLSTDSFGNTSGSIVKQTTIPVLIVPELHQFKPFKLALTAFKSGKLEKKGVLIPLQEIQKKFQTKVNLLLVKTPDYNEEDLIIDSSLKTIQNTFSISENVTTFQGVLEHFQSNNPDLLCVFRRRRGFFQKLWEKNTVMKSEFHCSIPLLILSGKQ